MVVALSPFFSPTEQKPRRGKQAVLEKSVEQLIEKKKPSRKAPESPVDSNLEKMTEEEKPVSVNDKHSKGIRGSMTLNEVEKNTGVPVAYILKRLELPDDTDPESRLGRLRRQHGFEMHKVRQIVDDYQQ